MLPRMYMKATGRMVSGREKANIDTTMEITIKGFG